MGGLQLATFKKHKVNEQLKRRKRNFSHG